MVIGGKGIHIIAPLVPKAEWPKVKDFAHRLAQAVAQSDNDNFTAALPKVQRSRVGEIHEAAAACWATATAAISRRRSTAS